MDLEFFVSHVKGLHSETNIVEWDTVGIRAKNKMIEIFNLGLNSSASKNEMQTKLPFGEKDMDYKILLLVYRDRDNHSAVWYPVVLDATVCFLFRILCSDSDFFCPCHLLSSTHIFFFFAVATPGELLCYIASAAAFYKKLYMFQVIDPSGIMKHIAHCLYTLCIHGYHLYFMHISEQSRTKFQHVCCFANTKLLVMITGFVS